MRRLASVVLLLLLAGTARGNGRPPASVSMSFDPTEEKSIVVGVTFGLIVSKDDGETWHWVCEQAVGYGGMFDPKYAVTGQGTYLATTFDGLSVSRDDGCTWAYAPAPLEGHWVDDVTVATDDSVWAATSSGGRMNDVFVSRDDAMTFSSTGLLHDRAWWKSVRVAPGNVMRVYVAGYQLGEMTDAGTGPSVPLLYRSDDGGMTWTEIPFDFGGEAQIRILGVSPLDEDLVFLRVDGQPDDTLLRSTDGALSWTPVQTFPASDLTSLVIWPDGQTVLAGSQYAGVYRSADGGETWAQLSDGSDGPRLACAGLRGDGELLGCGANWDPDFFAIARSPDQGQTWNKVFRFVDLDGALDCPDGTPQAVQCEPMWPELCRQFGICQTADGGPSPDGGMKNGGGGCGCGVSLGLAPALFVWRRRRRPGPGRSRGPRSRS